MGKGLHERKFKKNLTPNIAVWKQRQNIQEHLTCKLPANMISQQSNCLTVAGSCRQTFSTVYFFFMLLRGKG